MSIEISFLCQEKHASTEIILLFQKENNYPDFNIG